MKSPVFPGTVGFLVAVFAARLCAAPPGLETSAAGHVPLEQRNQLGHVTERDVQDAAEASLLLSRAVAGVYLPASRRVRIFEFGSSLYGQPDLSLQDFVRTSEQEVLGLNRLGLEAVLTFPVDVRLSTNGGPALDKRLLTFPESGFSPNSTSLSFREGFEGPSLENVWLLSGRQGTVPALSSCDAFEGVKSLDMFRGGPAGFDVPCTETFSMGMLDLVNVAALRNTSLVLGASSGTVSARIKCQNNNNGFGDAFAGIVASRDGERWIGTGVSGSVSSWTLLQMNVKEWGILGDITGAPVFLGMLLSSRYATGWGARFDNFAADATLPSTYSLDVARRGAGSGSVTSLPAGINCGVNCSSSFATNQAVVLTVTAQQGSRFDGWSGDCTGNSSSCTLQMAADRSVTARFETAPVGFTLSVSKTGSGAGTVRSTPEGIECGPVCSSSFAADRAVLLTPAPAPGSEFAGFGGACSGMGACTVTMRANTSVTARFDPLPQYLLSVTKGGTGTGTVTSEPPGINCGSSCSASYTSGQSVTLTASASVPSVFSGWGGACSGTAACVVNMSEASKVTASFNRLPPGPAIPLSMGRVSVRAWFRNQYLGVTGSASPLPQDDAFAYFHFGNPNNPEVFVKVLDFGEESPYLLFHAGLTDFEYAVEFTNVKTGQTVLFTKPAGSFEGGANNMDLPHQSPGAEAARVYAAPSPLAREIVLSRGKVAVSVTWRSQYSNESGEATPIPQKDEFAYFYFQDRGNPEVFVKVLDFGESSPYLLFYTGLTDFEYTVTFRHVDTGQTVSFKKEPGKFNGGADNTSLLHGAASSQVHDPVNPQILAEEQGGNRVFVFRENPEAEAAIRTDVARD